MKRNRFLNIWFIGIATCGVAEWLVVGHRHPEVQRLSSFPTGKEGCDHEVQKYLNHFFRLSIVLSFPIFLTTLLSADEKSEPQSKSSEENIPKRIIGKDGTPMVLIPAGEFQMGNRWEDADENPNRGKGYFKHQQPVHTVYVDAFYMDIYEVTNAQYQKFVEATGHWKPEEYYNKPRFNQPNQPVVGLSWGSARIYCEWVGERLPTEAEWEKAARGDLAGKRYPWGDLINSKRANYGHNVGQATPVGSYPPENDYSLYDMMGNVSEWCADWYSPDYYRNSTETKPNRCFFGRAR